MYCERPRAWSRATSEDEAMRSVAARLATCAHQRGRICLWQELETLNDDFHIAFWGRRGLAEVAEIHADPLFSRRRHPDVEVVPTSRRCRRRGLTAAGGREACVTGFPVQ